MREEASMSSVEARLTLPRRIAVCLWRSEQVSGALSQGMPSRESDPHVLGPRDPESVGKFAMQRASGLRLRAKTSRWSEDAVSERVGDDGVRDDVGVGFRVGVGAWRTQRMGKATGIILTFENRRSF